MGGGRIAMKILIIITRGDIGGAQTFVLNLAYGLKEKGEEVTVACGEGGFLKNELEKLQIPFHNFKWLKRTKNPLANLFFIFELKNFLNKNKFDIVHFNSSNTLFGALGAKLSKNKPKTFFTVHGLSIIDPNYEIKPILRKIYSLFFNFFFIFVNKVIFVSYDNLEIAKKIQLTKMNRNTVIHYGLDEQRLNFLPKNTAQKIFEEKIKISLADKFIIGSIGRLAYQKNYEFLINIFPRILAIKPDAILIIIGEGPERKQYEVLIERLNLKNKIFLIGAIKNASKYLNGLDLFVLPSRYEGLPLTLLETLFTNILILVSDVGGNKEIVEPDSLYELDNEEDFLNKFKKNINKKINSTIKKDKFYLGKMTDSYLKIFKE